MLADEIDFDDTLRLAIEERASLSPDALTGMEASFRCVGPETHGDQDLRPALGLAELDLHAPQRHRRERRAVALRKTGTPQLRLEEDVNDGRLARSEAIPNNVDLSSDKRLQRALEQWLPNYLDWWKQVGPEGFQEKDVYLRTAISVDTDGWAHFDYVKMPDYRWGIFLTPAEPDKTIGFGDYYGQPVWNEVPGEFRNMLRRIIVTQGDTEPASVEQQRLLGRTAPSLYDMRNLFQVNVEEGRHLWAMVYLLHSLLRQGRTRRGGGAARAPLGRRRQAAHPRRVQSARQELGRFLFLHDVHRPRRQISAVRAVGIGLRSAGAHHQVHAHRRSAPHVRRRDRHRPHGDAHRRAA